MPAATRRQRRNTDIWPGFVDALASLLMVIIFLLMVFVLAQFFLGEALSGRNDALAKLNTQVDELAELLSLERKSNTNLRDSVSQISTELQTSVAARDSLADQLSAMAIRAETVEGKLNDAYTVIGSLEAKLGDASAAITVGEEKLDDAKKATLLVEAKLVDAYKVIDADKEKITVQLSKIAALQLDIAALTALRDEMETEIAKVIGDAKETNSKLIEERKVSDSTRARLALLNKQMATLREQIARLNQTLDAAETKAKEQNVQITALGKRLNAALASKVQELSRYRSEFFGRLREVLGNHPDIRVVGDRFIFQSEVLFAQGSADIGAAGQAQLARVAATLKDIAPKIPAKLNWLLRVDGHTDPIPIHTATYPSNWELSAARAISVVRFFIAKGVPANRLAAAGFAANQPLDARTDEIAFRRNRRIEIKLTSR